MFKDQKKTITLPVEIVEKMCEVLEWIISALNFWKMNNEYPCNLICKVSADYLYYIRKSLNDNKKTLKTKKNK